MANPYPAIDHIEDGEAVNAAVTSRPDKALEQRTDALLEKADTGLYGTTIMDWNASCLSNCVVGTPVVLINQVYEPAVLQADPSEPNYGLSRYSYVCGIVFKKNTSTSADVAMAGKIRISASALAAVMDTGVATSGVLCLSPIAGKLTASRATMSIQVCVADGPDASNTYTLLIGASPRNPFENHVHLTFPLVLAATNPTVGSPAAGWVNTTSYASWFSSQGIAIPAGATWYYLHKVDGNLKTFWPPQPLGAAEVRRNGIALQSEGSGALIKINSDGIWYLSATNPPTNAAASTSITGSLIPSGTDRLDFVFIRRSGKFLGVASLSPAASNVTITNSSGQAATTGDLVVGIQFPLSNGTDATAGYLAVKQVDNVTLVQQRGVVLEGIKSDGTVTITGGTAVNEADGDPVSGYMGGRLIIGVPNPTTVLDGGMEILNLDNTEVVNNSNGVYSTTFKNGLAGVIRGCVRVPITGTHPTTNTLTFEVLVLAKSTGTLPDLTASYRRITRPSADGTKISLPAADTAMSAVALSTAGSMTAGQYTRKTSDNIPVTPGDVVYFNLSRSASDGYAGDVAILGIYFRIQPSV